jgi:hypothetical protein
MRRSFGSFAPQLSRKILNRLFEIGMRISAPDQLGELLPKDRVHVRHWDLLSGSDKKIRAVSEKMPEFRVRGST